MGTLHRLPTGTTKKTDLASRVAEMLRREMAHVQSFDDLESALLEVTNEACRRCLETRLQEESDQLHDEVEVDGVLYRAHQPGAVTYHSLCGPLHVRRWTYRMTGIRNGPTVVPLELAAGLVERCTPALAFGIARGYADLPMRDYAEQLLAARRVPPSRSTLERVAKRLGAAMHREHSRIEPVLRRRESVPDEAVAINLGLDRTSVPMEEEGEDGIEVHYRMAYLGTFALTSSEGETLGTRRYAVPAHEGPAALLVRLMADVSHALKLRPDLRVGVVQDGAAELWNLMRDALRANPDVTDWRETYDRFHVMEKLATLLDLVEDDPERRRARLEKWNAMLDARDGVIGNIEYWIEKRVYRLKSDRKREEAHRVLGCYFVNRKQFYYASLKGTGLLQGSGVTEAACKTMIAQRAKRSGQRWKPDGISAVLALKTLCESDRINAFWRLFRQDYVATVREAA